MKALMIKDLSRNDRLTVEEMKRIQGGVASRLLLEETYEPASAPDGFSAEGKFCAVGKHFKQAQLEAH